MRLAEDGSQAEVTNLDLALVAVNEDVVTLEVPVDDGWIMAVQVQQAAKDLPAPVLHRPYVHPPVSLPVPNHHRTSNHNQFQSKNQKRKKLLRLVMKKETLQPDMKRQQHLGAIQAQRLVTHWRRVPEVNISVMKLMLRRETSTQEV